MSITTSDRTKALITIANAHPDLNSEPARVLLAAVLPNTPPAMASYAAQLVRLELAPDWGAWHAKAHLRAMGAVLADNVTAQAS